MMTQRRELWNGLSDNARSFVLNYLKNTLKLDDSEIDNFLFPNFESTILNEQAMYGIKEGTERILSAILNGEKICVYGDYDCDGVPGTALVRDFFEKINYQNVIYYIPHRHTEGYGLNNDALQKLANDSVKLILTIDLGITNIKEIDFANTLGIDVIITDHHLPLEEQDGQILPKAFSIINNKQASCNYSNKDLCGSGTVYKLVCSLINELRNISTNDKTSWKKFESLGIKLPQTGYEKWLLDLVAIATIADMVPLTFENRTLAIYGLFVLSKTNRAGLQTLFQNAKVNLRQVNETDVAFTIAPRINSASRMAHPKIALSLFSQNLEEGINAAHELEDLNNERKETTKNIVKKIYKILDQRIESNQEKKLPEIVVIGDSEWNVGVLGILASKILEKYNVNVFVYGGSEEKNGKKIFKGSCRSRGDIHLVKLMSEVKDSFEHFGGHELAGGFSISFDKVHNLESELNSKIESARIPNLTLERKNEHKLNSIKIELHNISNEILLALNLIGPFGVGNPKPIFTVSKILETKVERFGKSREHLKMKLIGRNFNDRIIEVEAIKFFVEKNEEEKIIELHNKGELFFEIEAGWMSKNPRLKIVV